MSKIGEKAAIPPSVLAKGLKGHKFFVELSDGKDRTEELVEVTGEVSGNWIEVKVVSRDATH